MAQGLAFKRKSFIIAAKSIAFSAASLLGPNKCVKCIIDDDHHFELTSNPYKLLQVINVQHPAISIIFDSCKGLHSLFGSSCSTFIFMVGSWLQSFEMLSELGIPIPIINSTFGEAVAICIQEAQKLSLSIDDFASHQSEIILNPEEDKNDSGKGGYSKGIGVENGQLIRESNPDPKTNRIGKSVSQTTRLVSKHSTSGYVTSQSMRPSFKYRYSRHLVEEATTLIEEERSIKLSNAIERICLAVSRKSNDVAMMLIKVMEIVKKRTSCPKHLSELELCLENIFVESFDGKFECESFVFEGICISGSNDDLGNHFKLIEKKPIKVCLLDFDQTLYCKKRGRVSNRVNTGNIEKQKLLDLRISCVIYRGEYKDFLETCRSAAVVVLKANTLKHMKAISVATGNPIVSSIDDLELSDIGLPITLSVVANSDKSLRQKKNKLESLISLQPCHPDETFMTVLLRGTTPWMTMLLEERFRSSLHRLNNILKERKYVPGCGSVEKRCIKKLQDCSGTNRSRTISRTLKSQPRYLAVEMSLYRQTVFNEVAKGFQRYCSKLDENSESFEEHASCTNELDALGPKCESWKRAMNLVDMISRVDMVITSGTD